MEIRKCKQCGFILGTRPNISDVDGVCTPCIHNDDKKHIDWEGRQKMLTDFIKEKQQSSQSPYDCLIAMSGGKDSHWIVKKAVEHGIKHPLLVTMMDEFTATQAGVHNRSNISEYFNCDHIYYRFAPGEFKRHAKEDFINYCFPLNMV